MYKYTIASSHIATGNILHLSVAPKRDKDVILFQPGQYASISYRVNGRLSPMRCFSIVGSNSQTNSLDFAIRIEGSFTQTLANLQIGSTIKLRGPFGTFVIDEHYDRNIVMIAGGIGITPFISMVRASTEQNLPNRLTLLYSNSVQSNIPFADEIAHHEQLNQRFHYALFVSQGNIDALPGKRVIRGRIQESHLEKLTAGNFNRCTYFICGPRGFIANYKHLLRQRGVDADRIVTEEFGSANTPTSLIVPKDRASRLTYALTAASLIIGTGFMGSLDLMRYIPRYASAQASQSTRPAVVAKSTSTVLTASPAPAAASPSPTSTQVPATPSMSSAATPSASTNTPTSTTTPVAAPPAPAPVQTPAPVVTTYQAPVTSIS